MFHAEMSAQLARARHDDLRRAAEQRRLARSVPRVRGWARFIRWLPRPPRWRIRLPRTMPR